MSGKSWNSVYMGEEKNSTVWYPGEGVVKFVARYIQKRTEVDKYKVKKKVKRILDMGCGNGRHVVFFARQGFDVYGIDISKEAIEVARKWLDREGLKAHLKVGDIEKLPFEDEYFDVIVLLEVLDHISFFKASKAMKEAKRVLAAGGYVYVSLRSTEDSEFGRGEKIGHNTFLLQEGYEKGMVQHYFDLREIKELFCGFKIFDIELWEIKFPQVYTVDKAFLQSSKSVKRYLTPESLDMNLKYSRWYISAEKV